MPLIILWANATHILFCMALPFQMKNKQSCLFLSNFNKLKLAFESPCNPPCIVKIQQIPLKLMVLILKVFGIFSIELMLLILLIENVIKT